MVNWTWGLSLIALTMAIHATGIAFMAFTTLRIRHWIPHSGPEAEEGVRLARQSIIAAGEDPITLGAGGLALSHLTGDNIAALSAVDHAIGLNPNFANGFGNRALIPPILIDRRRRSCQRSRRCASARSILACSPFARRWPSHISR